MSLAFLHQFGLSETEASLYELLLSLGEAPVWKIVQESKLKRPTAYKALYGLEEKGLVTKNDKAKVIHFQPVPPATLLELADKKLQSLERAKDNLKSFLPQLTSSYILSVEKPVVTTFEGVKGLQSIYEDTLAVGKPIHAFLQTHEVDPTMYKWLTTTYIRKRIKKQIPAKVIVSSSKTTQEYSEKDQKELRESKIVSEQEFPFQHEVAIYGNKVAFINYKKDESLIGIVIDHPAIAQTLKAIFDITWVNTKN